MTSTTDSPGDSQTIYVYKGSSGDTITLTAKPDPSGATWPEELPTWSGATADSSDPAKATFPIDSISSSSDGTTVSVTCGTSTMGIKVVVFEITELELAKTQECDGKSVNADFVTDPNGIDIGSAISNVQFNVQPQTVDNPSGKPIELVQRGGNVLQWKIDNVRWFSTQGNHCNETSDYTLSPSFDANGDSHSLSDVTFTADAKFGVCLDGRATVTQHFSGKPNYEIVEISQNNWEGTVKDAGTFKRDVQAESDWDDVPANSQYYDMIKNEEKYHEIDQLENPNHNILKNYWLASNVMSALNGLTFTGTTRASVEAQLNSAFDYAVYYEKQRSLIVYGGSIRCALEKEAKQAAGASHRAAMKCTYSGCP